MLPEVTLAIFAYNQEKYVREAIEGAFAQTFKPLEIILSDDGSTDRTLAIMKEMAAAYDGPHLVAVRQECQNVGTVQHLINVARIAKGELLVVNAGDDVSYPERVSTLHAAWKRDGAAAALCSCHDEIDTEGQLLRQNVSFPPSRENQRIFRNHTAARRSKGVIDSVPGFSAAYPRQFWADLPNPPSRLFIEDGIASSLIILRGQKIIRVEKSLIAYRLLDNSLSLREAAWTRADVEKRERRIEFLGRDTAELIAYVTEIADHEGLEIDRLTRQELALRRQYGELVRDYWNSRPVQRLKALSCVNSREQATYILPRLLGWRIFLFLRALVGRIKTMRLKLR